LARVPLAVRKLKLIRKGESHRGIGDRIYIKELWAYAVNQDFLDEICRLTALEYLYLGTVSATDLSGLAKLRGLRVLDIEGATKVPNLEWARRLTRVRSLGLENLKRVRSLKPLASLTQLTALRIEGSMWTAMRVKSLAPLANLRRLEYLFMTNTRVQDGQLTPLHRLPRLNALQCANFFKREQFHNLAMALPNLRCSWFELLREPKTNGGLAREAVS
jgi:hypothetical protein